MKTVRLAARVLLLLAVLAGVVSMVGQWWGAGELAEPAEVATKERVRVEVLNAAGVPGLARAATDRLRDAGFDVVFFGNSRAFEPDSSLVLDRAGKEGPAGEVARVLEIPRVASRPDSTLYLDVTVVLGKDWTGAAADTSSRPSLAPEE